MAGTYPDAPGLRMAYDRDGSIVAVTNQGDGYANPWAVSPSVVSGAAAAGANSEALFELTRLNNAATLGMVVIFPELRDVQGLLMRFDAPSSSGAEWSANTTNGIDGTWTSTSIANATTLAGYRTSIAAVSLSGVKAIRWFCRGGNGRVNVIYGMHIYGAPSAGQNPHRLRFWQTAADAEIAPAHFDLGDVPRGTSNTVAFRVKNNSFSLTANGVTVANEALTDSSPSTASQHEYSLDGSSWTPTLNIGTLTPGEISGIVYARRNTAASVGLSLWWTRHAATAASWS